MTKEQLKQKYDELCQSAQETLFYKLEVAVASGAIDLGSYDDNYVLPKIVLTAALKSIMSNWQPLSAEWADEAKNLELFL